MSVVTKTKASSEPDRRPILVVEDDDGIREVLREALELEDYLVETASDGREALELLETLNPAVILLDLMLPEVSGWEVIDVLRSKEKLHSRSQVPIVITSAAGERVYEAAQRVDGYVHKPIQFEELLEVVARFSS